MNTLVLGIGNLLLQDEGAGVRAVEQFARNYLIPEGVELLDGGTSGIELLHYIRGRDTVIIIDVVKWGKQPGTIFRIEGEEVPALFQKKISPHQLGLSDLLATALLTGQMPRKVVLLGIEPKTVDTGLELSDEIGRNMEQLVDMIASELILSGFEVQARHPKKAAPPPGRTAFAVAASAPDLTPLLTNR